MVTEMLSRGDGIRRRSSWIVVANSIAPDPAMIGQRQSEVLVPVIASTAASGRVDGVDLRRAEEQAKSGLFESLVQE